MAMPSYGGRKASPRMCDTTVGVTRKHAAVSIITSTSILTGNMDSFDILGGDELLAGGQR